MAGAPVTFDRSREYRFTVEGRGELRFEEDAVLGSMEVAGPASLASLRNAITRHLRYLDGDPPYEDVRVRVSLIPERYYDHDFSPVDSVGLRLSDGRLLVEVETARDSAPDVDAVERILEPMLARERAELVDVGSDDFDMVHVLNVTVARSIRGRTVEDFWRFGKNVEALVDAADGGELPMWAALDLLRAGGGMCCVASRSPTGLKRSTRRTTPPRRTGTSSWPRTLPRSPIGPTVG
jgi:hypothetical protein